MRGLFLTQTFKRGIRHSRIYGDGRKTGNPFYTSLKPWNRTASDMGNFAGYLKFWGRRL
jgi:hypothetical protein